MFESFPDKLLKVGSVAENFPSFLSGFFGGRTPNAHAY
jgi:hypothetical protein